MNSRNPQPQGNERTRISEAEWVRRFRPATPDGDLIPVALPLKPDPSRIWTLVLEYDDAKDEEIETIVSGIHSTHGRSHPLAGSPTVPGEAAYYVCAVAVAPDVAGYIVDPPVARNSWWRSVRSAERSHYRPVSRRPLARRRPISAAMRRVLAAIPDDHPIDQDELYAALGSSVGVGLLLAALARRDLIEQVSHRYWRKV